jgi:hypothetical protein
MRQKFQSRRPSHSTVVAYLALFVALGGTTYAATGGNFILGQSNTAGAPTQLSSGTTNTAGAFKVTNTSTGRAITATGTSGGYGVWASGGQVSRNTAAVHGQSANGNGVEGTSGKDTASGVYGQNNSSGFGVAGRSTNGGGVFGESTNFDGVQGSSHSANASAVAGHNDAGGVGIFGGSPGGYSFGAIGNTQQDRGSSGWVKAMVLIDNGAFAQDHIVQCFNSQLPAAQATSGHCGFSYSSNSPGIYIIDFGFQLADRFFSVSPTTGGVSAGADDDGTSGVGVTTTNSSGQLAAANFYLFVY